MKLFTTIGSNYGSREHDARGSFRAPIDLSTERRDPAIKSEKIQKSFLDDLAGAIWIVIGCAIVPGVILTGLAEIKTRQDAGQLASDQPRLQYSTQYSNASAGRSNSQPHTPTPEGFGVPISQGSEDDPQKQD